MCGICGVIALDGREVPGIERRLEVMSALLEHRGPDDAGEWVHERRPRRVRPSASEHHRHRAGHQPMTDGRATGSPTTARSTTTRAAPGAGRGPVPHRPRHRGRPALLPRWGTMRLDRLRGMFAFALWDERAQALAAPATASASSRSTTRWSTGCCYVASEAKALLPFLPSIETDLEGLQGVPGLPVLSGRQDPVQGRSRAAPRPLLIAGDGRVDAPLLGGLLQPRLRPHRQILRGADLPSCSTTRCDLHMRSDVPVGRLRQRRLGLQRGRLHGHPRSADAFDAASPASSPTTPRYDESDYARAVAEARGFALARR